jgi:hypothetical protein
MQYNADNEQNELVSTGGSSVSYTLRQIKSVETLKTTLNLSASASFGWGVYSGSAAFNFAREASLTRFSNFLFLRVEVQNGERVLQQSLLSNESLARIRQNRLQIMVATNTFR